MNRTLTATRAHAVACALVTSTATSLTRVYIGRIDLTVVDTTSAVTVDVSGPQSQHATTREPSGLDCGSRSQT
jgi:hypothetical protein